MLDLDSLAASTYSAVISDICDRLGARSQSVDASLRPLTGTGTLVGWARTASSAAVVNAPAQPYGREIDFIDSLQPGQVVVAQTNGSPAAFWGELFSAAARGRGARGVVVEGYVRDIARVAPTGFHIFASGARPTDSLGRLSITAVGEPVHLGGVLVHDGDLVVADADGIVVVPSRIADEVAAGAASKAATETSAHQSLLAGSYLRDVWNRYGVL